MVSENVEEHVPSSPQSRAAFVLSAALAAVLILQAIGGLFITGLYRDNTWVVSIYKGTDVVTLALIVPLLIGSLIVARRGSMRARLVLTGAIYFVLYNNLYYLFSAFNPFFLVYVALSILSTSALIAILLSTDVERVRELDRNTPRKPVCVTMFVCAATLAVMWVGQTVFCIVKNQLPQLIIDSGSNTNVVAIFDLTLIVPPLIFGAVWLWQGRPWGRVIATALLVQGTLITVTLVATPPFQAAAGIKDVWTLTPLWALMGAAFLVSSVHMLRGIKAGA
jgi:hypothetical protein